MRKLTKTAVDALKPSRVGVKGSYSFLWDQELRGFGVQALASGLKSFVVQYRNAQGRSRRIVIGRYGVMTVEEARREAKTVLGTIAQGIDPLDEKQAAPGKPITVAEVCDWYLVEAEAGRILGRRRRPIKATTLAMDRSRIEAHIKPLLGNRSIGTLKLGDIEGAQADIAAGKTSKPRRGSRGGATTGGEGVAARTMSTLHAILEHALRLGKIEGNPAKGVRRLASTPRDRRLSSAELTRLGATMRTLAAEGEHPTGLAAIRLLLLTGFRRMEGLGLKREWVDAHERCIRLPETKTGAQVRVVGQTVIDLIAGLPATESSPYVFPADWGKGHFIGVVRVLDRACAAAKLAEVTPHTLRHTFASMGGELGFSELTIAALLGHAARGITQRYVHIDEALRIAADRISAEIAALLDGRKRKGAARAEPNTEDTDRAPAEARAVDAGPARPPGSASVSSMCRSMRTAPTVFP
jgi:integrase